MTKKQGSTGNWEDGLLFLKLIVKPLHVVYFELCRSIWASESWQEQEMIPEPAGDPNEIQLSLRTSFSIIYPFLKIYLLHLWIGQRSLYFTQNLPFCCCLLALSCLLQIVMDALSAKIWSLDSHWSLTALPQFYLPHCTKLVRNGSKCSWELLDL